MSPASQRVTSVRPPLSRRSGSGVVQRELAPATGERPDAVAYHEAASRLAEALERAAFRHAKVLDVLDLGRARSCRAAAAAARDASNRFRTWIKWDPPLAQRTADLALWREALRTACELGVDADPASG